MNISRGRIILPMLTQKVPKILLVIKQAKILLPKDSLQTLYFALVHSHYSYGLLTWANASNHDSEALLVWVTNMG